MITIARQIPVLAAACTMIAPAVAQAPVDEFRVSQIESEILRLQQLVDYQARRIEALERAARITPPASPSGSGLRTPDSSPVWLSTASWDRVKVGMSVQEVVAVLGRPTSTRNDDAGNLLLMYYAMELGPEKYLSGNIHIEESAVVEINRPELK